MGRKKKMKSDNVDWQKVHLICRRGRQGRLHGGDEEYAASAYAADPAKYGEVARRARTEVDDELRGAFGYVNPIKDEETD
jgi:hypothetical protein